MKVSLNIDFEISQLPISEMNIATKHLWFHLIECFEWNQTP